jgi:hypothetical protein
MAMTTNLSQTSTACGVAEHRTQLMRAAAAGRRRNRRNATESPPTPLVHRVRRRPLPDPSELDTAA